MTTRPDAKRAELSAQARSDGMSELNVPKRIVAAAAVPLLGSGKTDYPAVLELVEAALPRGERSVR